MPRKDRAADLVGELYELLDELDVRELGSRRTRWRSTGSARSRGSPRCSPTTSRSAAARGPTPTSRASRSAARTAAPGTTATSRLHIINYAQGAYEGFDGEADFELDAVDLTTVHRAKGLEWPVVFVPSMTASRFPSRRTGESQDWLVPRDRFDAARYEGSDADERRLFYVAMTRARDWLSVSRHERVTKQRVGPSPYHSELAEHQLSSPRTSVPPAIEPRQRRRATIRSRSATASWPRSSTAGRRSGCAT